MSEEFELECLIHKDIQHVQVRNDFLRLYQGNEVKAKIIRILETWTNTKRAEWYKKALDAREQKHPLPVMDLWVTMSYQQFSLFMYGTVKQETIKKNVKELLTAGDITSRPHPEYPYGPPQYHLNTDKIQEGLNKLPSPYQLDPLGAKIPPPPTLTPSQGVHLPRPRGYKQGGGGGKDTPTQGAKIPPFLESTQNHLDNSEITTQEDVLRDAASADITDTHTEVNDAVALGDTAGPVSRDDGIVDSLLPVSGDRASMVGSPLQAQDKATEATSEVQMPQTEEVTEVVVEPLAASPRSDIDVPDGVRRAQEVSDSYSHTTPDPLPSVSFLEANTARETGKQENMGAADENDTHSHDDGVEYVPEWAQGATNGSSAISSLCSDSPGTHPCGEVGTEETKNADGVGSEISSGVDANNPAMQQPDVRNRQPGPASRSAGERRTGERGAGPDTGDDRPVVPNGAAGNRVARGRGGKGTGVEPPALSPINTTLAMPDECAAWPNVETALLIAEHLRKRAFAPKQREKQAKKMQRVFADKPDLTREEWHNAYESRNDAWWNEHNGPLTVDDIYANDRLQKEIDRLAAGHPSRNAQPKPRAAPPMPAKPVSSPTVSPAPYVVDEERNKRNIARLMAGAQQAKQLGNVKAVIPMPVMD